MRPCVRIAIGDATKADAIETLPELLDFTELLLDFGLFDELEDFTDELLDFDKLLLDPVALLQDDEDFGALDEDSSAALEELEELETLEELELLGAVTTASRLSINLSETDLFNTGYLSLSDCVQAEPSKP